MNPISPYPSSACPPLDPQKITSVVSYEVRTSVTSIRTALQRLLELPVPNCPDIQPLLKIALHNTDRLTHLVDTLGQVNPVVEAGLDFWQQKIYYDSLTGLPNQILLLEHIHYALNKLPGEMGQEAVSLSPQCAVLLINLDRFRIINDSLGYDAGDQLLMAVAQRLATAFLSAGIFARLQANEFVLFLTNVSSMHAVIQTAEQVRQVLAPSFSIVGHDIFVTASIGIAFNQSFYNRPEELLYEARSAMYRAKELGKDRHEIFNSKLRYETSSRLHLETELRLAISRQEFELHYQPIVSLKTGTIIGFEALVRWNHPNLGMVPPDQFIPLAEESGLINQIGHWVLKTACQELSRWHQQFPGKPVLTISVNLSTRQFSQHDLVDQVAQALAEAQLHPRHLKLEITESAIMHNPDAANAQLQALKELGVQLHMDDFGTGYSSLAYLYHFPVETLKIDRSFINAIDSKAEQLEIVRTIIKLAWNLGIDVVAEGVETSAQLSHLKTLRCEYAQGYLFSQPLDRHAAELLIQQGEAFEITEESNAFPEV